MVIDIAPQVHRGVIVMEIKEIRIDWHWGYANQPSVKAIVDEDPMSLEWVYKDIPDERGTMLISRNNSPWYRFLFVERDAEKGDPQFHGALGGAYRLEDGSTLKTRTGWSSRAGVVNTQFRDYIYGTLVEVSIGTDRPLWAGFYCEHDYLTDHPLWPEDVYLVMTRRWLKGELYWIPSVDEFQVVKADKPQGSDRYGRV